MSSMAGKSSSSKEKEGQPEIDIDVEGDGCDYDYYDCETSIEGGGSAKHASEGGSGAKQVHHKRHRARPRPRQHLRPHSKNDSGAKALTQMSSTAGKSSGSKEKE